jgi:acyl-CoA thioesterase I
MSRGGVLILAALLAAIGLYWYMAPTDMPRNYPSRGTDIIAFGDSLVSGVGSSEDNDFVSVLSRKIGQPIINMGMPGETTKDGVKRINAINDYKPKVVLVLLGGNDALQRIEPEATFANLRTIVNEVHARGAIVVLIGVRGGILNDRYPGAFEALSRELDTAYVPDILDGLFGDQRYMSDAVHPNDAGYAIVAERVYRVLEPLLISKE